jgi:hypothetical protein
MLTYLALIVNSADTALRHLSAPISRQGWSQKSSFAPRPASGAVKQLTWQFTIC